MQIIQNISLKALNSFGIEATTAYFTEVISIEELKEALTWCRQKNIEPFILGGGSNVLFTRNFNGLIIKNSIPSISIVSEDAEHVYVKAGAGVLWHDVVLYCLENNFAGVENLALIPGFAGASPMQNIGAYGVELKEVFHELNAVNRFELTNTIFDKAACEFGYRESVFKNKYKDQFVITDVTYRLNKTPCFHIEYGALRQQLEHNGVTELSIRAIADAVMNIRSTKLPDPAKIGNAGSFFKNPSISQAQFETLKDDFPGIVSYPNDDGTVKIAAAWMIEQCGFKGVQRGDAGVHEKQALVLVNYGNATGLEILSLCHEIKEAVLKKFDVVLMPEVNII